MKNVPLSGDETLEQCIEFMRTLEGDHPLGFSCVHPEPCSLVEWILTHTKVDIRELIGNFYHLGGIVAFEFTDKNYGEGSVSDIIEEFKKPGRDSHPEFKIALFKDDVEKTSDLTVGMTLEGVATNVAYFGAFVDIGVHQDDLVHISQLADEFFIDPRRAV